MFTILELNILDVSIGMLKSCIGIRDDIPEEMLNTIDKIEQKIKTELIKKELTPNNESEK